MTDFETNPIGTEQALREAMDLLGIKVEGSPVIAWKRYKSIPPPTRYSWQYGWITDPII